MSSNKKNSPKLSVDGLVKDIQKIHRATWTTSIFKSILLKKLKGLNVGGLTIIDGSTEHKFGDPDDKLHAKVNVLSQEFYVFLGSGGINGAAEAYTAGYWSADDLVKLIQVIIKNLSLIHI